MYLIPQAAQGTPAPRGFAVLSKREGAETDRSSVRHYFTRGEDGGAWKAVVATWVVTEAPPQDATAAPTPSPEQGKVKTRPKVLPPGKGRVRVRRGVADRRSRHRRVRALCEPPQLHDPAGKPDGPHFARGDFTDRLVDFYNGWHAEQLLRSLSFKPAGERLPVLRLKDGGSLVICTLEGVFQDKGRTPADWIKTNAGSDAEALLGGGTRKWASIEEVGSVTAVMEVPQGGGPATVLSTDAYGATKLSVKGVEWK
ncbi:hypothetical protein PV721_40535 [Streptomyces sp. MB09-01]|uniref:hypothetical protein n=1 Tax=Streptomyces sp. MB09-01 TaxID=3028666 RepID=UPI0029BD1F13|nr:hypothetical protein [Streptomyces sp. MB09-01]MDX3540483.1 hypothetical protein [Streptomyces sp. MB09-01]